MASTSALAWLSPAQDRWLYDYRLSVCALVASIVTQTVTVRSCLPASFAPADGKPVSGRFVRSPCSGRGTLLIPRQRQDAHAGRTISEFLGVHPRHLPARGAPRLLPRDSATDGHGERDEDDRLWDIQYLHAASL
jgi:hypothetical protein